ncbi:MAG: YARHG domain-containing protein [Myxococcales bacterium]|nr:YARHG domain-containing protein [Myxococcales bacterium]
MILLLFATVGLAEVPCDIRIAMDDVREHGRREAYDCLMSQDEAGSQLVVALLEYPGDPRLSRALAMWMLPRADEPFDPVHVAKLSADDKRLLVDGIRARRGRKSPVPRHEAVFRQFDWYQPVPTFTDGRLRPGDKAQIELLNARDTRGTVTAPPAAELRWMDRVLAWFTAGSLETLLPVALVGAGVIGSAVWLRRPKA